jgi:hypothetical protein
VPGRGTPSACNAGMRSVALGISACHRILRCFFHRILPPPLRFVGDPSISAVRRDTPPATMRRATRIVTELLAGVPRDRSRELSRAPAPAQRNGSLPAAVGHRVPRRPTAPAADTPALRSGASPRRPRRGEAEPPPRSAGQGRIDPLRGLPLNGIFIVDTTGGFTVTARVQKWGNSLALRLPKALAD